MEYVKLKDVFSIKKGKKVEQVEKSENTIRYIQIDDLRNNDNIKYCEKNERYVYAQERDIIIAWDGANAGTIGYGLNGAIGSTLALLTKNDDRFKFTISVVDTAVKYINQLYKIENEISVQGQQYLIYQNLL